MNEDECKRFGGEHVELRGCNLTPEQRERMVMDRYRKEYGKTPSEDLKEMSRDEEWGLKHVEWEEKPNPSDVVWERENIIRGRISAELMSDERLIEEEDKTFYLSQNYPSVFQSWDAIWHEIEKRGLLDKVKPKKEE
jgi:hypothetical protein